MNLYFALIYDLHHFKVEYAVVQKNSFFEDIITDDFVFESLRLFLHNLNLNISILKNIQIQVM